MLPSLRKLTRWATGASFTPAAVATFLDSADFELVAYADAHRHTVVTHERPSPLAKKRILIPDACDAMRVPWTDPPLPHCEIQFGFLGHAKAHHWLVSRSTAANSPASRTSTLMPRGR